MPPPRFHRVSEEPPAAKRTGQRASRSRSATRPLRDLAAVNGGGLKMSRSGGRGIFGAGYDRAQRVTCYETDEEMLTVYESPDDRRRRSVRRSCCCSVALLSLSLLGLITHGNREDAVLPFWSALQGKRKAARSPASLLPPISPAQPPSPPTHPPSKPPLSPSPMPPPDPPHPASPPCPKIPPSSPPQPARPPPPSPPCPPPPSVPPASPLPYIKICLTSVHATGVRIQHEGMFGTSDPALWIFQRVKGVKVLWKKTASLVDTVMPGWLDAATCIALEHSELCFEIRDDFPDDNPQILNEGCTRILSPGPQQAVLDAGAMIYFNVVFWQYMPSAPPPTPPQPPYDYRFDDGALNPKMCVGMLNDPGHLFQHMWAANPWSRLRYGRPSCFERKRDDINAYQKIEAYFRQVKVGEACDTNWYEGNEGKLGDPGHFVKFSGFAPALLGFDETIDHYCQESQRHTTSRDYFGHAGTCINGNLNILSLYGNRVPYNICRNLEWQVCAAKGLLPGQGSKTIRFAIRPGDLHPHGNKPFGECRGWRDAGAPPCDDGYATDDIFFLETCMYSMICSNGHLLFSLNVGEDFICEFSDSGFAELQRILTEAAVRSKTPSLSRGDPKTKTQPQRAPTCSECYEKFLKTGTCAGLSGCTNQLCNFC